MKLRIPFLVWYVPWVIAGPFLLLVTYVGMTWDGVMFRSPSDFLAKAYAAQTLHVESTLLFLILGLMVAGLGREATHRNALGAAFTVLHLVVSLYLILGRSM